jgi:endogenous inhibitor of DNA gyrase (YacG/DUF329 family)
MTKNPVTPMPSASRQCPICGKPATARHQPFCSGRCADIDLGRWLKGTYSVPSDEPPEDAPPEDEREG